MAIFLNKGIIIKKAISNYQSLKSASSKNLGNWSQVAGGTGVTWEKLNEDLSLKRFIKNSALQEMLRLLQGKSSKIIVAGKEMLRKVDTGKLK